MKTVTDLRFLGDWNVWVAVALALVLAAIAWKLYRREVRDRSGNLPWLLPALRSSAVFLIVMMLAGPVLHHRRVIGELARVMIFVDSSRSMSVTDEFMDLGRKLQVAQAYDLLSPGAVKTNQPGFTITSAILSNDTVAAAVEKLDAMPRWQRMEHFLLNEKNGLVQKLAEKHNVELWAVAGAEPQRLWSTEQGSPMPKSFAAKPEDDGTDLGNTLGKRIGQKKDERAVVLMLSDGQHNQGNSPIEIAKVAGGRNIPVFTVAVGAMERPGDLAVIGVKGPEAVFFEDRVRGEIVVKDDMQAGQQFMVKIEESGRTLWEKSLVTERSNRRRIEFDFPIREMVEARKKTAEDVEYTSFPMTMKISIPALDGEKDRTNNESLLRFRAVTQRRKLLLLDGRPRWEFRYIRNIFERDPQWEVNSLVAGIESTDTWRRGEGPGQFPSKKELLFAYDLICFGEVPRKLLNENEFEWIKEFVDIRGGGLFLVDGRREVYREYGWGSIATLFPVERESAGVKEPPSMLRLTDRGSSYVALRLTADTAENAKVWQNLPPPHWVASVKAFPGTETLVEAVAGNRKIPVVVLRQFGAGKVLYMGMDETWRWRYNVADQYQEPYWHQLANAIMEQPYAVRDKYVALDAGSINYRAGESVEIRVRLRDEKGRAISHGNPQALLYCEDQKIATIALFADENSGGAFRGRTGPLAPGRYQVRINAKDLVPEKSDVRAEFYVQGKAADAAFELGELNCNEDLLLQMAKASGGEYCREEDASKLARRLEPFSKGRVEESETILWQSWWWFIPLICLLTAEWILRKRSGLI
ncbi:MAG: VWA domain-containing protein [Kiritimatiellae bacterium]|nr:VWA domain-containing protein [Kiritimatiellia bacterium]MDD5522453.1 VWA domain-containing protein [Kiritimatiellia bacterium]